MLALGARRLDPSHPTLILNCDKALGFISGPLAATHWLPDNTLPEQFHSEQFRFAASVAQGRPSQLNWLLGPVGNGGERLVARD